MGRSSKETGGEHERSICNALSLWVTNGARDDVFWRSAMSGGRETRKRRTGGHAVAQAGDISAVSSEGFPLLEVFAVECKHYKDLMFVNQFWGLKGLFPELWDVHLAKCQEIDRVPLLICRQSRKPNLLITDKAGSKIMRRHGASPTVTMYRDNGPLWVFLFSQILRLSWRDMAKDLGVWVPQRREVLRVK